jgi:hypothetical protein
MKLFLIFCVVLIIFICAVVYTLLRVMFRRFFDYVEEK